MPPNNNTSSDSFAPNHTTTKPVSMPITAQHAISSRKSSRQSSPAQNAMPNHAAAQARSHQQPQQQQQQQHQHQHPSAHSRVLQSKKAESAPAGLPSGLLRSSLSGPQENPPSVEDGTLHPLSSAAPDIYPDLLPWTPDRVSLTAESIRKGVHTQQMVSNEQATCVGPKTMVLLLKSWTAMPALSYFLSNAMQLRESSRRVTAPHTFKPPPRVTVTDRKREAWLANLANMEVPLRKLSRTIPHGLSNAILLESCLAHNVPIMRAIWLVRCLGANEIRALRRKAAVSISSGSVNAGGFPTPSALGNNSSLPTSAGTPGAVPWATPVSTSSASPNAVSEQEQQRQLESGWLLGWTDVLLSFIDGHLAQYSRKDPHDWLARTAYLAELQVQLYYESMIDRRITLTWIIENIERARPECLVPIRFFINIYWTALAVDPYVTKLIRALANRTATLRAKGHMQTSRVLEPLLLKVFRENPTAFILPDCWWKIEPVLERLIEVRMASASDLQSRGKPDDLDSAGLPYTAPQSTAPSTAPSLAGTRVSTPSTGQEEQHCGLDLQYDGYSAQKSQSAADSVQDTLSDLEIDLTSDDAFETHKNFLDISSRMSNFTVRNPRNAPLEWKESSQIGQLINKFKEPYDYKQLATQLRSLNLPSQQLVTTILRWSIDRASQSAILLFLLLAREFKSAGINIYEGVSSYLFTIDFTNYKAIIFQLVDLLLRYDLFDLNSYFRRLIATGILYSSGRQAQAHRELIANLPFKYLPVALQRQASMLVKNLDIKNDTRWKELARQFGELLKSKSPDRKGLILPDDLTYNENLELADSIYEMTYETMQDVDTELTMDQLSLILRELDKLNGHFTQWQVLCYVLKTTHQVELFVGTFRMLFMRLFPFVALGILEPIVLTAITRIDEFKVNFPSTEMAKGIAQVCHVHVKSPFLKSIASQIMNDQMVSGTIVVALEVPPSSGVSPLEESELITSLTKALEEQDTNTVVTLRLVNSEKYSIYESILIKWIGNNLGEMDFVARLLANNCVTFARLDESLHNDQFLLKILFTPIPELGLNGSESMFMETLRRHYIFVHPLTRVVEALISVKDPEFTSRAIAYLLGFTTLDPEGLIDRALLPISRLNSTNHMAVKDVTGMFIRINLASDNLSDVFEQILTKCDPFNYKFCQMAVFCIFRDIDPAVVVQTVMERLLITPQRTPAWQYLFEFLDPEVKCRIFDTAVLVFLDGSIPHQRIDLLTDVIDTLGLSVIAKEGFYHIDDQKIVRFVQELLKLAWSSNSFIDSATSYKIYQSLSLVVKILVISHSDIAPLFQNASEDYSMGSDNGISLFGSGLDESRALHSPIIEKVMTFLREIQTSPQVSSMPRLATLVSDALKVFGHGNQSDNVNALSIKTAPLEGLVSYSRSSDSYEPIENAVWPFDLIEETSNGQGLNDLPVDLSRFETYLETKGPS